jgi:hypothetical protein
MWWWVMQTTDRQTDTHTHTVKPNTPLLQRLGMRNSNSDRRRLEGGSSNSVWSGLLACMRISSPPSFVRSFVRFFLLWLPPARRPSFDSNGGDGFGQTTTTRGRLLQVCQFCPPLSWREQPGLWIDNNFFLPGPFFFGQQLSYKRVFFSWSPGCEILPPQKNKQTFMPSVFFCCVSDTKMG